MDVPHFSLAALKSLNTKFIDLAFLHFQVPYLNQRVYRELRAKSRLVPFFFVFY
jgi:hypothetical protein